MYRSWRELSNAYLLAKFGFDTAENEPSNVWPIAPPGPGSCRGPAAATRAARSACGACRSTRHQLRVRGEPSGSSGGGCALGPKAHVFENISSRLILFVFAACRRLGAQFYKKIQKSNFSQFRHTFTDFHQNNFNISEFH